MVKELEERVSRLESELMRVEYTARWGRALALFAIGNIFYPKFPILAAVIMAVATVDIIFLGIKTGAEFGRAIKQHVADEEEGE